ncbi:DNA N-6-adenine-methyltransferase [Gallibacterium salpingitidis]|uniref:Adenine methyltransferase n=1 Tax=Gallibacterium salpingitidis TaxID=505341 RepID=A0A1A7NTS1_9PAST|nr:DNA N-6-adenine-methyltransferase [Gallibacterium salpingitidis]OBW93000.1 adenine methyltransferase [Gallibacterium salpingitidis]
MSFDKDTWQTPKYLFKWIENRFGWIHLDGCANKDNALTANWIGKLGVIEDFLVEDICEQLLNVVCDYCDAPLRIFVNPPYSNVTPFLKQAKVIRDAGHMVIMLLNNDKSTRWYQECIYNVANEVIDITGGRVSFIHPVTKQEIKGNSKGQMIVVFDPAMEDFVTRQVSLDFIKQCGAFHG